MSQHPKYIYPVYTQIVFILYNNKKLKGVSKWYPDVMIGK